MSQVSYREKYNPGVVEKKWQAYWDEHKKHKVERDPKKEKYYVLEMFPYPSGKIHMGHVRNYSIADVVARYKKMNGYNVLHPMGWDAFGMPAEGAAIKNKTHPYRWTMENISSMKQEFKGLGYSYDWDREVATCLPSYYRWEQMFFLRMLESGLVYRKESDVNWCEKCSTVLANEQVQDGICWRCDEPVIQKSLKQWFLKITQYADELLEGCDLLDGWPEKVRQMQKNWIGKSRGVEITFPIDGSDETLQVFTTRPDTLYGATFVSVACGHPLLNKIVEGCKEEKEVKEFAQRIIAEQKQNRQEEPDKEGVFTGRYAINPINNTKVPIYAANFVLMAYGTGAVMAVPAHDQRDFEFARKYGIPIKVVIEPPGKSLDGDNMTDAYTEAGTMVNSSPFDGIESTIGKDRVAEALEKNGNGKRVVHYRLRDWGISRQRYWGNPIPIIYCDECGTVPVPCEDLPVELPTDIDFPEDGRSPLATEQSFIAVKCPKCGKEARRESDTMDTFVQSSWYFLRFASLEKDKPFDAEDIKYWLPVDQYIGGVEHAILHLLYSRFFTKVLRDMNLLDIDEPFTNLLTQGMVIKDGFKMSKSKGNVVNPGDLIKRYGADTVRIFILFASPPEKELEWSDKGVEGAQRFLNRVWALVGNLNDMGKRVSGKGTPGLASQKLQRKTHETIKRVSLDVGKRLHFNTAISAIMELVNECYLFIKASKKLGKEDLKIFAEAVKVIALLLSPFAPHISEEIWEHLGFSPSVTEEAWPNYNPELLKEDECLIIIQVNGKVRGRFSVPAGSGNAYIEEEALKQDSISTYIAGKTPKKVIVVPSKLVNIVI